MIKKCDLIDARNSYLSERNLLILIFFLSLILRLLVRCLDPVISRDGCLYIQSAQILAQKGNGFSEIEQLNPNGFPPLLLFAMASLIRFGISATVSGIGLNIIAGSFCPCIVYSISKEILPKKKTIALSAAILTIVNPSMVALSIEPQRDMIYLFFCGFLILLILKGVHHQKNWYYWALAGIVFSMSFLTRYETLEFIPIIVFFLTICTIKRIVLIKKALIYGFCFLICSISTYEFIVHLSGLQDTIENQYKTVFREKINSVLQSQ